MSEPPVFLHSPSHQVCMSGSGDSSPLLLYLDGIDLSRLAPWVHLDRGVGQDLFPWPLVLGLPPWAWEEV